MRLFALGLTIALVLGVTATALAKHDPAMPYTVDLTTGEATEVGPVGTYPELVGLAAAEVDGETVALRRLDDEPVHRLQPDDAGLTGHEPRAFRVGAGCGDHRHRCPAGHR
jgi:hypothetical protein